MMARAALVWCLLLVVAVVNGVVRVALLEPRLGEHPAHVTATLVGCAVFAVVIWLATPWIVPGLERPALLALGAGWMAATVAFEFLFGHYVAGHSWSRLMADYDVSAGRLWPLVLLIVLVGPALTGALRTRKAP